MIGYSKAVLLIITLVFIAAACTVPSQPADNTNPNGGEDVLQCQNPDVNGTVPGDEDLVPGDSHQSGSGNEIDYNTIKPNEAGKIMVLMYHVIGDSEGEWSRRWDNFKKDLEVLYQKGYRLISLDDYISNNIDIEAGYTPVVITFDDGTQGQFNILKENGEFKVDPKSAVGIMEEFYSKHPDFGLEATFFVYYPVPFRQKDLVEYKLRYLVEKGMDIGNHTYGHANLGQQDAAGVRSQLGRMVAETKKYLPDYNVNALALPYGANAKEQYREYVYSGEYEGVKYQNDVVLLVGSNPAPSPVDKDFDPRRVPRIRATDDPAISTDMYDWIENLEKNPRNRYISDGVPETITIPREMENRIDPGKLGAKKLKIYDPE